MSEVTADDRREARRVVKRAVASSLHCTIASHGPGDRVHLTPIGSLILADVGRAFYFDVFNRDLGRHVAIDPRVAILAVDSRRGMWLRSLLSGRFASPPGVRLDGTVGPARRSSLDEVRQFQRVVGPLVRTRGGAKLWGRLPVVRDVTISSVTWLQIGDLTISNTRT